MALARRMGMSEDEFFDSCPIFFNECAEVYFGIEKKEKLDFEERGMLLNG